MILLVTRQDSVHANLIERNLRTREVDYFRLNVDKFQQEYSACILIKGGKAQGYISSLTTKILLESIRSVWWYDFPLPYVDRNKIDKRYYEWARLESHNGLLWILSCLESFYMNDPTAIDSASIKSRQLITAAKLGFDLPDSIISRKTDEIQNFHKEHKTIVFKTIVPISREKDIKSRTIFTTIVDKNDIKEDGSIEAKLNFLQEYIPKRIEVRATVVGQKVLSAEIHSQKSSMSKIDWRKYDIKNTPYYRHDLPKNIEKKCLKITHAFGLSYSCIDMIVTPEGKYYFLELNPVGLWAWIEALTGLEISKEIANMLIETARLK